MAQPLTLPLHWREGLFLRPHHFQQLQRQLAQHQAFLMDSQFPHRWGVLRLAHDERVLPTGTYSLASCAAVLRDGLIAKEELLHKPLELDLKPHQAALKGKWTGIYLAVPRPARAEVVDFTSHVAPEEDFPRRFIPVEREAADLNTGENPQVVNHVAINARLMGEWEDRAGFECIKLAEVVYREDSFQLNASYCPPTVLVAPGSPLHLLCTKVLGELQEGARYVIGLFSQQSAGQREAMSLETRLKVHGLLGSAPYLEGLLGCGAARPLDLYLLLCRILGDVVGLQPDADLVPEAVPAYDHENLAVTFEALRARIDECLRPVIRRKYPDFPFRPAGDQEFHLDEFRLEWLGKPLYLAANSPKSTEELQRWMDNCLIGVPGGLADFRRKMILGLDRTRVDDPPPEIGLKRGWAIYRLGIDPRLHAPLLEEIKREGKLAVRTGWQAGPGVEPPQRVTLIVKVEEEGPARAGKTGG